MLKTGRNDRLVTTGLIGYLATNRSAEAEAILNEILKKNSNDLKALIQRSQVHLRTGNYDAAAADLDRAGNIDSASAQAHYLRSKIYRSNSTLTGRSRS